MANPFNYNGPLEGRSGFHGRTSELTRIASRIAADRPQSVSVVAAVQAGKSSLVNYLLDAEVQAEYLEDPSQYVLPRMRLSYDPPQTPDVFFQRLASALAYCGIEDMEPTYDGFGTVVRDLMAAGRKMVLFLDDFGVVTSNAGYPLDFFSFMRSVANSHDVGYLTTSSDQLQKLCHTQDVEESPFFNIFTTVTLEPFTDKAARAMVTEAAQAEGTALDDEVEWILELGGRHPYLLQVAAGLAFEEKSAGTPLNRDSLASRAFEEAHNYLERLWGDLSEPQRQVLSAISGNNPVEKRHQYAVESLERQGLLIVNGSPKFAAHLVQLHAERNAPKKGFFAKLFG